MKTSIQKRQNKVSFSIKGKYTLKIVFFFFLISNTIFSFGLASSDTGWGVEVGDEYKYFEKVANLEDEPPLKSILTIQIQNINQDSSILLPDVHETVGYFMKCDGVEFVKDKLKIHKPE